MFVLGTCFIFWQKKKRSEVDILFQTYLVGFYNLIHKDKQITNPEEVLQVLDLDSKKLRRIGLSNKEYFDWSSLSQEEKSSVYVRLQMMEKQFGIEVQSYFVVAILPIFTFFKDDLTDLLYRFNVEALYLTGERVAENIMIFLFVMTIISLFSAISLNSKIYERKMFAIYLMKQMETL